MTTSHENVVRVVTRTLSDTRTPDDDAGGALLRERLAAAGFTLLDHAILREDPGVMAADVRAAVQRDEVDAIVLTGGTGIAPRDRTIEAVLPLFDKVLDGFGEAFRRLSWDEIGPRAILSRAAAGTVNGRVVVALPGSPNAVRLGVDALLAPMLGHAVAQARGRSGQHKHKRSGSGDGGGGANATKGDPK